MASACNCCYLSVQNFINLLDPCICNMPGGGVLVLSTGTVYIRNKVSSPCAVTDFVSSGAGLNITFVDDFGGTDVVNLGDTVTFNGLDGISTKIFGQTLTINGNARFGLGAPVALGDGTRTLNYIDTNTNGVYFWNPNTLSWFGPFFNLNFQNSTTIQWTSPTSNIRQADVINAPLGGLTSSIFGETIKQDLVTNAGDNSLALSNNGVYIPPATRQIGSAIAGTTDESLPYKVVQVQAGIPVVVNTYHKPVGAIKIFSKIGLQVFVTDNTHPTQPNDATTTLWSVTGGGVISSPTASTTLIQFPSAGEYVITLISTNEAGLSDMDYITVKVDRILEVGGTSEESNSYFSTLQAAFNWINANDSANASLYTIVIQSVAQDVARIVPNFARVVFGDAGQLNVGVDFTTVGQYSWSGTNRTDLHNNIFSSVVGSMIVVNAGITLELSNLTIEASGNNSATIVVSSAGGVSISNCFIESSGSAGAAIVAFATSLVVRKSVVVSQGTALSIVSTSIEITHNVIVNSTNSGINVIGSVGAIEHNRIQTNASGANNTFCILAEPHPTSNLFIQHNTIIALNGIAGAANAFGVAILNTGVPIVVTNNSIQAEVGVATALTNNTSFIFANNYVASSNITFVNSAGFGPPLVGVVFNNFPAYGNIINGPVAGVITFAAGTPYPNATSGNFQV